MSKTRTPTLHRPTYLARKYQAENVANVMPRDLTALAKKKKVKSVTTADGMVLIEDDANTREVAAAWHPTRRRVARP